MCKIYMIDKEKKIISSNLKSLSVELLWLRYQCRCTHPQSYHGQSECWVVEGANAIVLGPQLHIWSYFYMLSQTFFSTNVVWCSQSFFNVHMSSTKTVDSLIQFLDFQLRLFVDPNPVELWESYVPLKFFSSLLVWLQK